MSRNPHGVQRKRIKGYRMPNNTVSVARPGRFGNPFSVTEDRTAEMSVKLFAFWLYSEKFTYQEERKARILAGIKDLRGKNLACFCRLGSPCHRDVLLYLANE